MVISRGWVAGYSFDGNSNDLSGHAHNGIINTPQFDATLYKLGSKSLKVQSASNAVSVADHPELRFTNSLSISFWLHLNALPQTGTVGGIIDKGVSSYIIALYDTGELTFSKNGVDEVRSSTLLTTGSWVHIVAIHTDGYRRFYLNGLRETANPFTRETGLQNFNATNDPLIIGSSPNNTFIDAHIDEMQIWNRPLTESEITALYNANAGYSITPVIFPLADKSPDLPLEEVFEENTLRSPMESGITITRPRFTKVRKRFTLRYSYLTETEILSLQSFEQEMGGSYPFNWTHPRTNISYQVRFTAPVQYRTISNPTMWSANFSLQEV